MATLSNKNIRHYRAHKHVTAISAWQLVWCHERCSKPDKNLDREDITSAAAEAGFHTVLVKKAAKYGDWLTTRSRVHVQHVLVTSWREAKPCIARLMQLPAGRRPRAIAVFCELPCDFIRASRWSASEEAADIPLELVSSKEQLITTVLDLGIHFNCSDVIVPAKPHKLLLSLLLESPPGKKAEASEFKHDSDTDAMPCEMEPFLTTWKVVGIDSDIVTHISTCNTTKELEQFVA